MINPLRLSYACAQEDLKKEIKYADKATMSSLKADGFESTD